MLVHSVTGMDQTDIITRTAEAIRTTVMPIIIIMSLFKEEHTVDTYNQSSLRPSNFTSNIMYLQSQVTSYLQSI